MKHIYIALPYSHDNIGMRKWRFEQCLKYSLELATRGLGIISPVLMTHDLYELSLREKKPIPYEFWVDVSELAFKGADELHLLTLEGWEKSTGVKKELEWAKSKNIPIIEVSPTRHYVNQKTLNCLEFDSVDSVSFFTDYILWDSSSAFVMDSGLPSNDEVKIWIKVLSSREDAWKFEQQIKSCREYIKDES